MRGSRMADIDGGAAVRESRNMDAGTGAGRPGAAWIAVGTLVASRVPLVWSGRWGTANTSQTTVTW